MQNLPTVQLQFIKILLRTGGNTDPHNFDCDQDLLDKYDMIEFKVLIQSNMKWFPASAGVCDEYINLTADAKLQLEDWKIQSDPAERDVKDN